MNTEKDSRARLKVGLLGCRGIPNRYGGYEQFAQYLGEGLVERGHQVWVYQSSLHPFKKGRWKGVYLLRQADPEDRLGTFGQFIYDFNCLRDARKRNFDVLLQMGYTSSVAWFPFWPSGPVNMIHMDGLEWKRTKYSIFVRAFLRWMEWLAAHKGEVLLADSTAICTHLKASYRRDSEYIPYGAPLFPKFNKEHLLPFGLEAEKYYLAIARLVPENNLLAIIEGVLGKEEALPLMIVGDTGSRYGQYLLNRFQNEERVIFAKSIFEPEVLDSLRHFSRLYFHGHSVGGTNPSLLEAMACGALICAHDNTFNRPVLEDHAFFFRDSADISDLLAGLEQIKRQAAQWAEANLRKIRSEFNWEKVVDSYEALFIKHNSLRREKMG